LDDDVDARVIDHRARIRNHVHRIADEFARALDVQIGDLDDLDAAPGPAADFVLVAAKHLEGAAAYRADAEQADPNGPEFFVTHVLSTRAGDCPAASGTDRGRAGPLPVRASACLGK